MTQLVGSQVRFAKHSVKTGEEITKLSMEVIVSLIALGFGIWVLISGSSSADLQKWAAGWIGLVVGYWLK